MTERGEDPKERTPLGRLIRAKRKKRRMSLDAVAAALTLKSGRKQVIRWEDGENEPTAYREPLMALLAISEAEWKRAAEATRRAKGGRQRQRANENAAMERRLASLEAAVEDPVLQHRKSQLDRGALVSGHV